MEELIRVSEELLEKVRDFTDGLHRLQTFAFNDINGTPIPPRKDIDITLIRRPSECSEVKFRPALPATIAKEARDLFGELGALLRCRGADISLHGGRHEELGRHSQGVLQLGN